MDTTVIKYTNVRSYIHNYVVMYSMCVVMAIIRIVMVKCSIVLIKICIIEYIVIRDYNVMFLTLMICTYIHIQSL